jgi:hypothetical protein
VHLEYAHQQTEMNILEREVLHRLAEFAISTEVFKQNRVRGDASKCTLPEVKMAVSKIVCECVHSFDIASRYAHR